MSLDLATLVERNAAFTPEKTAIRFEGASLGYAALASRIARAAGAIDAQGVRPGDRVAILALNHPDYLVLLYACARLGAMLVPINWRLAVPELLFILADSGARLLVLDPALQSFAGPLQEAAPDLRLIGLGGELDTLVASAEAVSVPRADLSHALLLVYTSGTTGRPKGAVLPQSALIWNGMMSQHMHDMTAQDHVLTVLPFFHVGGLNIQTTPALHLGATVTIHARFAPAEVLAAIACERPSLIVLVPATIQALLDHPGWQGCDLSSLRIVATGSTIVPQKLVDAIEARGVPVLQVYGATETCPVSVYTRLGGDRTRPGSTGLPGLACELRIARDDGQDAAAGEAGEILLRGPQLFTGYWNNPEATQAALNDGWYHTGDIGTRDADGYLSVHDRKKNMIISGGENIYPAEIERVLCAHASVADAAVIGRADPRWQEVPVAYVMLRPGASLSAEDAVAHVLSELARFKAPREVIFVSELPRNALGKVQHFRLKQADKASKGADGTPRHPGRSEAERRDPS